MINAFELAARINESASGYTSFSGTPCVFYGNITESIMESRANILMESASAISFMNNVEELMVETAAERPENLVALSEASVKGFFESFKKFFTKLWENIKGIVNKIVTRIHQFAQKTDKWAKAIGPRIEAAKKNGNASSAQAEMYEWDSAYVVDTLPGCAATLVNNWKEAINDNKVGLGTVIADYDSIKTSDVKPMEPVYSVARSAANNSGPGENEQKDSPEANTRDTENKGKIATFSQSTTYIDEQAEKIKEGVWEEAAKAASVSFSDKKKVTADIIRKCHGDSDEKRMRSYYSDVDNMFSTVKESKKTLETIKKTYEGQLKILETYMKKINDAGNKIDKKSITNADKGVLGAVNAYVNAAFKYATGVTTAYKSAIDSISSTNTGMLSSMVKDYMSVLAKFAGIKAPKEEKA